MVTRVEELTTEDEERPGPIPKNILRIPKGLKPCSKKTLCGTGLDPVYCRFSANGPSQGAQDHWSGGTCSGERVRGPLCGRKPRRPFLLEDAASIQIGGTAIG